MNAIVAQFGQQKTNYTQIDLEFAKVGCSVQRVINIVTNVESKSPVICAVLCARNEVNVN